MDIYTLILLGGQKDRYLYLDIMRRVEGWISIPGYYLDGRRMISIPGYYQEGKRKDIYTWILLGWYKDSYLYLDIMRRVEGLISMPGYQQDGRRMDIYT